MKGVHQMQQGRCSSLLQESGFPEVQSGFCQQGASSLNHQGLRTAAVTGAANTKRPTQKTLPAPP